jgi:hypothetical protein
MKPNNCGAESSSRSEKFSEQKIADALNIDVLRVVHKKNLLNGICPESVDLLKDKMVPEAVFNILKQMGPIRQSRCNPAIRK